MFPKSILPRMISENQTWTWVGTTEGFVKAGIAGSHARVSNPIGGPWGLRIGVASIPRCCCWPWTTLENRCSSHCPRYSWRRNAGAYDLNVASETGRSAYWEKWNAYCGNEWCSSLPHPPPQSSSEPRSSWGHAVTMKEHPHRDSQVEVAGARNYLGEVGSIMTGGPLGPELSVMWENRYL